MVNGAFNPRSASLDFGLEDRDSLVELVHREGVEILLRQLVGRIVGSTRKILVGVHHCQR